MQVRTSPLAGVKPEQFPRLPKRTAFEFVRNESTGKLHNGVDLPAKLGAPVRAAGAGVVTHALARWEPGFSGYGGHVVIRHADGTHTLYAHLDSVSVAPGDRVATSEVIGGAGNTTGTPQEPDKRSGGVHVHFEASPRKYPQQATARRLDPAAWIRGEAQPEDPSPAPPAPPKPPPEVATVDPFREAAERASTLPPPPPSPCSGSASSGSRSLGGRGDE